MSIGEAVRARMIELAEFYNRMDALPYEEITDYTRVDVVAVFCEKMNISLMEFFNSSFFAELKDPEKN